MSYHIEVPHSGFKELPDRILVREDGYLGAYKFYGEPIVDYWYVPEQDAPQAALEKRIDELCAEVERLRKQLHDQQDTAGHNFVRNAREYKRVCDENAKLREFAEMMLLVCKNQGIAGGVFTQLGSNSNLEERVDFESRARELGI